MVFRLNPVFARGLSNEEANDHRVGYCRVAAPWDVPDLPLASN